MTVEACGALVRNASISNYAEKAVIIPLRIGCSLRVPAERADAWQWSCNKHWRQNLGCSLLLLSYRQGQEVVQQIVGPEKVGTSAISRAANASQVARNDMHQSIAPEQMSATTRSNLVLLDPWRPNFCTSDANFRKRQVIRRRICPGNGPQAQLMRCKSWCNISKVCPAVLRSLACSRQSERARLRGAGPANWDCCRS